MGLWNPYPKFESWQDYKYMNPYGPYQTEFDYELAAAMREFGIEPSLEVQRTAREVDELVD